MKKYLISPVIVEKLEMISFLVFVSISIFGQHLVFKFELHHLMFQMKTNSPAGSYGLARSRREQDSEEI